MGELIIGFTRKINSGDIGFTECEAEVMSAALFLTVGAVQASSSSVIVGDVRVTASKPAVSIRRSIPSQLTPIPMPQRLRADAHTHAATA